MSDRAYLTCACQRCGAHIEFPADGVGVVVDCPHCGEKTALSVSKPRKRLLLTLGSSLLVILLAVAGLAIYRSKIRTPVQPAATNGMTQTKSNSSPRTLPDQAEIETNHFRIGSITLEKAEGGGITYAVGTLKNDSEHQRFGVKIMLDVMDADDHRIGGASDYIAVLEPSKEWRFRALVNEPGVSRVKVAGIGEQK